MKTLLIGVSLGLALTVGPVLAQDCKPSKYGPADEIGAANLVTPERVLAASKLVKQGKSHPLGIVVVPGMPAYPRSVSLQVVSLARSSASRAWRRSVGTSLAMTTSPRYGSVSGRSSMASGMSGRASTFYNCNNAQDISHHWPDEAGDTASRH